MAEKSESKTHNSIVVATTVIMGLIAIATAWSGFQATKWGGHMSNSYAAAAVARSNSVLASLTANQQTLLDIQLFIEWINAIAEDDSERLAFYYERMRDEVKPVMEAWLATEPRTNPDAPSSPFVMPEYVLQKRLESEKLESEAVNLSEQALEANKNGDNYVMTTVILASGLFFSGIATRFRWPQIELVILIVAIAAFSYGLYQIISYPVLL
jgi:hypothetical protein